MDAASDFTRWRVRTALVFLRAGDAIRLARSVDNRVRFGDACAWILEHTPVTAQRMSLWAMVLVCLLIPSEVNS